MKARTVSVTGLGYVGLPLAAAFARRGLVVGFDCDPQRVAELKKGHDRTRELAPGDFQRKNLLLTCDPEDLRRADFHIVAVPTPVDSAKRPDLEPLLSACRSVGAILKRGDIVVFESTVYPGATEEDCAPALELASGLKSGRDFFLGYSPERINPGDRAHGLERVVKIVSGQDERTLKEVARVYARVAKAGVHRAPSIRTAEAAKVIENTQRDLNIALVNELAMIFARMGLDTREVLAAAGTKWNFLPFAPGLVGGHCIGVDPYYLTHKAAALGHAPEVILAGRRVNDSMAAYCARRTLQALSRRGPGPWTVTVLGLTFKENIPDARNSQAAVLAAELARAGARVQVHDPVCDPESAEREYGLRLVARKDLDPADAVVLAVAHREFARGGWRLARALLRGGRGVVADIKAVLPRPAPAGVELWRL